MIKLAVFDRVFELSTNVRCIRVWFSFTRERVKTMLQYITKEGAPDEGRTRGHKLPFFSDMVFGYNKKAINE